MRLTRRELTRAFADGRRVLRPDGVGTVVFASKTTASWEAILKAVVDAGFIITDPGPSTRKWRAELPRRAKHAWLLPFTSFADRAKVQLKPPVMPSAIGET